MATPGETAKGKKMTKKKIMSALAVVSAAMFALPAIASAGTPTIDPGGTSFASTFGLSTLGAKEEPTITCEGENHLTGTFNGAGGNATGGTISLDYTKCHLVVLGFTIGCKTTGAPLNNTIALTNIAFDLTYSTDSKTKPALLITNLSTQVQCGSTTPLNITGGLMGTITAPACGEKFKTATMLFSSTANVQDHMQITGTGTKVDLLTETNGSGTKQTSGLNTNLTVQLNEAKEATLTCV
jgi:hypothetical protein